MNIFDVPIVSYCYNSSCDADNDLQKKLIKHGFKNVKTYNLGIIGYNNIEK